MAKAKSQVPLLLRDEFTSTTSEQAEGEYKTIDISAYVDPLNGEVLKIVGVKFMLDNGSGLPLTDGDILSYEPVVQLVTGTQTGIKAISLAGIHIKLPRVLGLIQGLCFRLM